MKRTTTATYGPHRVLVLESYMSSGTSLVEVISTWSDQAQQGDQFEVPLTALHDVVIVEQDA